ncbi:hypothetical protein [Deinococcus arenicola]|uniref:Uncharacterized protein n=1 Tax=Deinococcus arenicola TaxID=2994950 RepID=A0ABU4DWA5_9DEIO|nr:hypothetical protein [Deinococcus sp. ZS9-10]MDV6376334.1 hypothetical protein [Deinococcus sp. ZS9-10]
MPELDPLITDMKQCAQDMQRLLDALELCHHEDYRVSEAATTLHNRLSRFTLQIRDRELKAIGR